MDEFQKAEGDEYNKAKAKLAGLIRAFGVRFLEENKNDDDLAAAVALFLFGDADRELPGGYSTNELDEKSPVKLIASFPQEFVLLGRATVLLKGIAKRLDVPFSLAEKWGAGCRLTVSAASSPQLPLWGKDVVGEVGSDSLTSGSSTSGRGGDGEGIITFRQVASMMKKYGKQKTRRFIERVVKKLPPSLRSKVLEAEVRRLERKEKAAASKD